MDTYPRRDFASIEEAEKAFDAAAKTGKADAFLIGYDGKVHNVSRTKEFAMLSPALGGWFDSEDAVRKLVYDIILEAREKLIRWVAGKTFIGITLAKDYDRPVGHYVDTDGNVRDAYTLYFRIYRCMSDCGFFVLLVKTSKETAEQLRADDPLTFVV